MSTTCVALIPAFAWTVFEIGRVVQLGDSTTPVPCGMTRPGGVRSGPPLNGRRSIMEMRPLIGMIAAAGFTACGGKVILDVGTTSQADTVGGTIPGLTSA